MADENKAPPLADLVSAGQQQTEAVRITDGIFMAKDISNAYLVNTGDGDLMVNTGFMTSTERNKKLLEPHRTGPMRHIILTQAHADHFSGVPTFREDGTTVIAGAGFTDTERFFEELGPFLKKRSGKLWASITRGSGQLPDPPFIEPDIMVEGVHSFEQGDTKVEVHKVPGGESPDSAIVRLPGHGVIFTGNLFGPVFGAIPNLITVRGDKPRSITQYLDSVQYVIDLEPELLITGHGEPVHGKAEIRAALEKMHRAMSRINEAVIDGMNAGKTVGELMREIDWPNGDALPEYHGKLPWVVRGIWEGYAGWIHYEDGTTTLYDVPRRSVDADLVELAGGADAVAKRAAKRLDAGEPLEAIHLTDIALNAHADHRASLQTRKAAHEMLLERSGGTNLSETMWLKNEIAAMEQKLG